MVRFVGGIMISERNQVVLINKLKPSWQCGRVNVPGGHIELGETERQACVREFQEETGQVTFESDWTPKVVLYGPDFECTFFHAKCMKAFELVKAQEQCFWNPIYNLPTNILWNLRWILRMVQDDSIVFPLQVKLKEYTK